MTKPGALKILHTLEESSFIHRNPDEKQYTLGPALLRLGNVYRELKGISDIAQPILRHISDETTGAAYITLWEKSEAFLLFLEESPKGTSYRLTGGAVLGDPIPIHTGASAKLLASFQPREEIQAILAKDGLRPMGAKTITDPELLFREFDAIRAQGYAVTEDEYEDGMVALSIPIPESDGRVVLALSISGYKTWISKDDLLRFLPLLVSGAERIAHKLSFRN